MGLWEKIGGVRGADQPLRPGRKLPGVSIGGKNNPEIGLFGGII